MYDVNLVHADHTSSSLTLGVEGHSDACVINISNNESLSPQSGGFYDDMLNDWIDCMDMTVITSITHLVLPTIVPTLTMHKVT